jgi:protein-L-isoaspartate(D-aspartate) O-methyltransferase
MSRTPPSSQSIHDDLAAQLRQQLVESLLQAGVLQAPALEQAFLRIPREAFVPYFYEQEATSPTMAWRLVCADELGQEDYLTAVYRNQSLVTKLDERRWPVSSSSQPAVMARMLEALDVQPGQLVLEIGTGSGYNAALLATLTGEASQVVTIERDAELASTAGEALERVLDPGMTVIVEDGVMGWPPGAPYDRIIATASAPTLPMAWVKQLRPEGKLVMDLQGTLASGFLVVEKTAARVSGHFLPEPLHFMPLETEAITMPHTKLASLLQQGCQATFTQEDDAAFPETLLDPAFRWFVQWRIPGCQVSKRKQLQRDTGSVIHSILVIEPRSQALVRFQKHQEEAGWRGEVFSSPSFWQELQQAYAAFHALGEPGQQQYQLIVEEEGPALLIGSLKLPLTRT